ncbi:hypothetical protein CAPTEDRAFT_176244 [Capitella teleta]|uniref:Cytochrome b5 n=1 Tax=Capitella teleta TaxID=283909 RepID=R7TSI4_CAPTE|nr:hypothetical protein CAPTEDRAFT_176244 [Capitella teleta]|eukprot:ELT96838.1 hypothetical protein CAPTEDRAFT_176244 [Capitella teleta]
MSKKISLEELSKHTSPKDLWMSIHDDVYDITKFLEEHPGGEEVLLECGGKYGTAPFEDVGHSMDARELMKQYKVGELEENDKEKKAQQFNTHVKQNSQGNDSSWVSWLVPIGIACATAVVYRYVNARS